jgi:2-C-methyl-D-erythritol 4-phosphate cytidylyltransferase
MGGARKAFLELNGVPLLLHALRPFLSHPKVACAVIALAPEDAKSPPLWLRDLEPRVRIVAGGATRTESVFAAIEALPAEIEIVLVHDAARPLATREIVDRCIAGVGEGVGVVVGVPASDTLKVVDSGAWVTDTPDRRGIWHAQTPQGFPKGLLRQAYRRACLEGIEATDDAALFAREGGRVRLVEGSRWNLKVTVPEDLALAELLLARLETGSGTA